MFATFKRVESNQLLGAIRDLFNVDCRSQKKYTKRTETDDLDPLKGQIEGP